MFRLVEIFNEEENLLNRKTGLYAWGQYQHSPYVPFYFMLKSSHGGSYFRRSKLFQFSKYSPEGVTNTTLGVLASEYFADPIPALLIKREYFYVLS